MMQSREIFLTQFLRGTLIVKSQIIPPVSYLQCHNINSGNGDDIDDNRK